jgi:all-trans-retinol 13,14-reductase
MGKTTTASIEVVGTAAVAAAVSGLVYYTYCYCKKEPCPNEPVLTLNPVKQGFSMRKVPSNLDVIVIGSGIGGLTMAVVLAKEGKRVLVLEQHDIAGGNTHTFEEKGYEFDTGLHYVGGKVGEKGSGLRKQLDYITNGQVKWVQMDYMYDVAVVGQEKFYMLSTCWSQVKGYWELKFPDDKEAIDEYFRLAQKSRTLLPVFMGLKNILPEFLFRFSMRLFHRHLGIFTQTTKQVLESITQNRKLMGVLSYLYGDYGEVPDRGAFFMNALIEGHYQSGAYYLVGGPLQIAESAATVLERWGGKVLVRAPVSSIVMNDQNEAIGVVVKGNTIRAKAVVSSIGVPGTYTKLIPDTHKHLVQPYVERIQDPKIASLNSLMTLFVGLDDPKGELKLPKQNYWIFPSWDHEANHRAFSKDHSKPPLFFISFSSAKDPSYATRHPGKQVALVIGLGRFDHVEPYQDDRVKHRRKDYMEMKKEWEKLYLNALIEHFPEVKDKIDFVDFGTAVTNDFYLGTYRGAVYGLAHSPERFNELWLRPRTPIKNLFLSGQDVMCCGIAGAMAGGYFCAYSMSLRALVCHCIHGLSP